MPRSIKAFIKPCAYPLAAIIAFLFCFAYLFISYHQISQSVLYKKQAQFLEQSESINKAFRSFDEYMGLLRYRILNSALRPETIPSILNWRPDSLIGSDFPAVTSMKLSLVSNPETVYTRLGVVSKHPPSKANPRDSVTYLGKGEFKINRTQRDKDGSLFGWLEVVFSIKHLLHRQFTEDEIKVAPIQNLQSGDTQAISNIPNIPFALVFNPKVRSFWGFVTDCRVEISLALMFSLVVFLAGLSKGRVLGGNRTTQLRIRTNSLEIQLRKSEEEKQNVAQQLLELQKTLQLKECSSNRIKNLSADIQQRYQGMVKYVQTINTLIPKLIAEVDKNHKTMREIRSIFQENTVVLQNLANGYLMKDQAEYVDLVESIENIKTIFLPEMREKNVQIEVKSVSRIKPHIDRTIFEIIIYNIFRLIMGRLIQNNTLKINMTGKNPIKITFQDNGYDVREKIEKTSQTQEGGQIWSMDKKTLMGYAQYLGWEIAFVNESIQSNLIEFLIYPGLNRKKLPHNVIPLFESMAHDP